MTDLTKSKLETELHLVGALLLDNRTIAEVSDILQPGDFTNKGLGLAYRAVVDQWQTGADVTATSVCVDCPEYAADMVWEAYAGVGSAIGADWYAKKIKEASTRRELVARAKNIEKDAKSKKGDVSDLIGEAQTRMFEIEHKDKQTTIAEDFVEVQRMSEAAASSEYGTVGVPTGYKTLDDITGGLKKQDLTVIAARPSIGKTALGTNIFQNIIESTTLKAMFFSGEMSRHQILLRMASRRSLTDNNALARGNLSKDSWKKYTEVCGELTSLMEERAWIDDKSRPSPGHIRAVAKQRMQSHGLDVIFVDYLNIMSLTGYNSRYEKLTEIVGSMKALAKDLNVPIVLLAQVGRGAEHSGELHEPNLNDLKGTGSIEEDADIVLFVHRDGRIATRGKLIIGKHRNGPLDVIPVTYEGALTSFKEIV